MENVILETSNLKKSYGNIKVLDDVNISLKEGHIYGFIGANGSGKTTLMSILTGLAFASDGTYSILGKIDTKDVENMRKVIGSTIEGPALYPQYSAYENLELQRRLVGNPDKSVCEELLKLVNLFDVRSRKVKKFSMGMKQRLSIAMTLVGKPKLLILDEPVNGLDPKNISELRMLLKKLNEEQNVTMLISSHILSELYQLASDYIIIHKGRIIDMLSHDELEAKCRKYVQVKTEELPKCITAIERALGIYDYKIINDNTVHIYQFVDKPQRISRVFLEHEIVISELSVAEDSIETYFLEVTGGVRSV